MFVVIDSNFLHGNLKVESQQLQSLFDVLKKIGWTLIIPEPVIIELEMGAREKYREAKDLFDEVASKVILVLPGTIGKLPTEEDYLNAYRQKLKDVIKQNDVLVIGFPKNVPSTPDLFKSATLKSPPFDKTGNNFRDAVLWLAVREFCDLKPESQLLFLTKDGYFKEMISADRPKNLSNGNYETIKKILESKLDGAQKERHARLVEEISYLAKNEEFTKIVKAQVSEYVQFAIGDSAMDRVLSIDGLILPRLISVDSLVDDGQNRVSFRARYEGLLTATHEFSAFARDAQLAALKAMANRPTRIGESRKTSLLQETKFRHDLSGKLNRPTTALVQEKREHQVSIDVIGVANLDNDNVASISVENVYEGNIFDISI